MLGDGAVNCYTSPMEWRIAVYLCSCKVACVYVQLCVSAACSFVRVHCFVVHTAVCINCQLVAECRNNKESTFTMPLERSQRYHVSVSGTEGSTVVYTIVAAAAL